MHASAMVAKGCDDGSTMINRRFVLQYSGCYLAAFHPALGLSTPSMAATTQGPFRSLDALGASLASAGVSVADQRMLQALARPALALQTTAAADDDVPIGASKMGGAPDLPPTLDWPVRGPTSAGDGEVKALQDIVLQMKARTFAGGDWTEQQYLDGIAATERELNAKSALYKTDAPLTFLMQLDLAHLATFGTLDADMPTQGRLYVFYDMIVRPWFARDTTGAPLFKILFDQGPKDNLKRHTAPDPGYRLVDFTKDDPRDTPFLRNHMPAAKIVPVFTYTLPDIAAQPMFSKAHVLGMDVPQAAWTEDAPAHLNASNRFGGWPELIQNDMAFELVVRELDLPDGIDVIDKAVSILAPEIQNWMMLLQIGDYDNDVWDLNGLYYIWIKRGHMKVLDFSKAEMIYQTD
jgi:Domain of unknown function (DUF1963)